MTTPNLKEIRERVERATLSDPKPTWDMIYRAGQWSVWLKMAGYKVAMALGKTKEEAQFNANFIASAKSDILSLLGYVEELQKQATSLRDKTIEECAMVAEKLGYSYPENIEMDTYDDAYEQGFDLSQIEVAKAIRALKERK